MPNKLISKTIGLTANAYANFNRRPRTSQFFRERNSINRVRMRELSDDRSSVSLSQTTATIVREIVDYITVI